ncbi:general substrate transporter [Lipomyces starkeyi]
MLEDGGKAIASGDPDVVAATRIDHEQTKWECAKQNPRAVACIIGLLWVLTLAGFDNQAGSIAVSIPQFRKDFGHYFNGGYVLDASWQSAISGAPLASWVTGALMAVWIADQIGRKPTLFCALTITLAGATLEFVSTTIQIFFAGKFLNGFGIGFIQSVGVTYIAEISPMTIRGIATGASNISMCIGPFVCYLISDGLSKRVDRWAYRGIFCAQWGFAGVALLFLFFIPESPWYLVRKNKEAAALRSLQKLSEKHSLEFTEQRLAVIRATIIDAADLTQGSSYLECFRGVNLRRTMVACMPMTIQQLSGVNFISNYSTYYYQLAGFSTEKSFQISCGAQALSVSGTIVSLFLLDRFGRRPLLFYGLLSVASLLVIIGGLATQKHNHSAINAACGLIASYNFFYNLGLSSVCYAIMAETATARLRVKTTGLAIAISHSLTCMWAFVLPFLFNPDHLNLGAKTSFIFGGFGVILLVYLWFCQPETANRSFAEIDEMYAKKVSARQFKHFKTREQLLIERDDNMGIAGKVLNAMK